jgi:hypothetical protein
MKEMHIVRCGAVVNLIHMWFLEANGRIKKCYWDSPLIEFAIQILSILHDENASSSTLYPRNCDSKIKSINWPCGMWSITYTLLTMTMSFGIIVCFFLSNDSAVKRTDCTF